MGSLGNVSGLSCGEGWILTLLLSNNGTEPWPENTSLVHCFGSDMGCGTVTLDGPQVQVGETIQVQLGLSAPEVPCQAAWILASGDQCFGPVLKLAVQN